MRRLIVGGYGIFGGRGRNPLARLIANIVGFPQAGADQSISVQLIREGEGERWVRTTRAGSFSSVQTPGRARAEWLVRERFGPLSADMAIVVVGSELHLIIRRWRLFGVPMPLILGPRSVAVESVRNERFCFDVTISHPLTGLIVRYRGQLTAT